MVLGEGIKGTLTLKVKNTGLYLGPLRNSSTPEDTPRSPSEGNRNEDFGG